MANPRKTYFLAPTRDTPPAAAIQLGHLITDPAWPEENILNPSILPIPSTMGPYTTTKHDVSSSTSISHDTSPGIFTEFLQSIAGLGVDLDGHYKREHESALDMAAMETTYFSPTVEYVREAVQAEEVRAFLRKKHWLVLKRPVYMITGLKIARGAKAATKMLRETGVHAQVSVDLSAVTGGVPISVGPKLGHDRERGEQMNWNAGDDFIFAYRLRKIVLKKGVEVKSEMLVKGALYNLDEGTETLDVGAMEEENLDIEEQDEYDGMDDDGVKVKIMVDDGDEVGCALLPEE